MALKIVMLGSSKLPWQFSALDCDNAYCGRRLGKHACLWLSAAWQETSDGPGVNFFTGAVVYSTACQVHC